MGSAADEDEALSDFEDDAVPVVLPASPSATAAESLKAALAELELERQARKSAEAAKAESQSSLGRLKTLTQEAVRQRDEAVRQREEAHRLREDVSRQLHEALQRKVDALKQKDEAIAQRDDAIKQKDEIARLKEESSKARDASRAEIEAAARLLITGAEKITARASSIKTFSTGLPRSSSYTGVAAIAYGFTKRAEEIVDEVVRQHEFAVKGRTDMREQMEQRNYQIAIEVSQLEASIQQLKGEVGEKVSELEKCQKLIAGKDGRIAEIEQEMLQKLGEAGKQAEMLKEMAQRAETKVKVLESKVEQLNPLLSELFQCIFKANETLVSLSGSFSSEIQIPTYTKAVLPSNPGQPEQWLHECLIGAKALADLFLKLRMTWKEYQELRKKERDDMGRTIGRLVREKEEITNFLRNALAAKQEAFEAVSKSNAERNQNQMGAVPDAPPRSWAIGNEDARCNVDTDDGENISEDTDVNVLAVLMDSVASDEIKTGEAISMASALDNEVKSLRQEIFELQQMLAVARGEVEWLRVTLEGEAKELSEKLARIHELERKEAAAMQNIEGLTADLAAVEEEVGRWKEAATEEAAAGAVVLEESERCQEEIKVLQQQITHLSQALEEANNKMRSKEEMAAAAIAVRNAAERSLRIADERAGELRERIEEMTRQLEELEGRGEAGRVMGLVDMCWPLHWFRSRLDQNRHETGTRGGAEMEELLEPLV